MEYPAHNAHLTTKRESYTYTYSILTMSWNAYTESLIATGKIDQAAIYSAAGDSLWAESGGFQIPQQEISNIAGAYSDPSQLQAHGLYVQGKKYFLLRVQDRSIYAKLDDQGVVAVQTKQAIVIAHYPSGVQAPDATAVVEKLADYLISVGY